MKKITFIVFLFWLVGFSFLIPSSIFAQTTNESSTRYYDCGKTGKCIDAGNELEALYSKNLIPGFTSEQNWFLENKSSKSCRIYLRLKSLDNEVRLPEKITLSAFEVNGKKENILIDKIKFSELLEKQSLYLVKLPKRSTVNITWNILLDESVDNSFQAVRKKFSTLLYSYCLDDKNDNQEGKVAGVTTEEKISSEDIFYIVLIITGITLLTLLKLKKIKFTKKS